MFLFLSLAACFQLDGGRRTVFTGDGTGLVLHFDKKHVVGGKEASAVVFEKSRGEGEGYNIRFDDVSICPRFSEMKIVGCADGKWWDVKLNGPYFRISTKDPASGKEYCWIRSHRSMKNKIRLGVCNNDSANFKVEDKDAGVPRFKKFVKRAYTKTRDFVKGFFDIKEERGWDSESTSSSKEEALPGKGSENKGASETSSSASDAAGNRMPLKYGGAGAGGYGMRSSYSRSFSSSWKSSGAHSA